MGGTGCKELDDLLSLLMGLVVMDAGSTSGAGEKEEGRTVGGEEEGEEEGRTVGGEGGTSGDAPTGAL